MHLILIALLNVSDSLHRGMWVRASALVSPDSIAKIIAIADTFKITDIYAQVVIGGYAYYDSKVLPKSQYLTKVALVDYDPLDYLLWVAHKRSLRVHAWINTLLVWSLATPPDSTRHIFYQHPEWFIKDVRGRSMAQYSYDEWKNYGLEGLYIDPARLEVRQYIADICAEIAREYRVDGVHLDFIRYPGTLWGLPEGEMAAIFSGLEADTLRWLDLIRYPRLSLYLRWMVWHFYQFNRWRNHYIAQLVKEVRSKVQTICKDWRCAITAAIFSLPSQAHYRFGQEWWRWGDFIDYPVIMSYTPDTGLFTDMVNFGLARRRDAVFGIGLIWPEMRKIAYWQMDKIEKASARGLSFFDFKGLDTLLEWKQKIDEPIDSFVIDSSRYAAIKDLIIERPDSDLITMGRKFLAWGEELEFAGFLLSLSLNPERDLNRLGLTREQFLKLIENDVAFFKSVDLKIFPLGRELIEPPWREVRFEFLPWSEDSNYIRMRANQTKQLTQKRKFYPWAMDRFGRAVFRREGKGRNIYPAPEGIYAFKIKKIYPGGKKVLREKIPAELLPLYLNWTIKMKFMDLVMKKADM